MRQHLITVILIVVVLALLVCLNVLFVSDRPRNEDEVTGSRSSYSASPYGTLAFYTFLAESGHEVVRFERPLTELADSEIGTLVLIAPDPMYPVAEEELEELAYWVESGGRVLIADRQISTEALGAKIESGTRASSDVRAVAASCLTHGVERLSLSPYATTVDIDDVAAGVHFEADEGPFVVGLPYSEGHVTVIGDSYVLQNNGIREADNLPLALNLVELCGGQGRIGFDEYHHGHGYSALGGDGSLRQYVSGTPVPYVAAQLGLVAIAAALVLGRRLGRPIPRPVERRTSALEFVGSMANIQRLARASDLAIENIYSQFRSRLCRTVGLPSNTPSVQLAEIVANRTGIPAGELRAVMTRCEKILASNEHPEDRELVRLVSKIRDIEHRLAI